MGVRGTRTIVVRDSKDMGEIGHMTLLTDLSKNMPFYFNFHHHHNTGEDFKKFIAEAIYQGYLTNGDYLVMDNAAVHFSHNVREETEQMLRDARVISLHPFKFNFL